MSVKENLAQIQHRIHEVCQITGRNPDEITIVAVTKYVTIDLAGKAIEAGIKHIGENRDVGLLEKKHSLGTGPTWHYIGSLQTRKTKDIINEIDYIHSLDRISLAKEINKRSSKIVNCFVQVNTSGEGTKHGLAPDETIKFIKELSTFNNLRVVGLMTMAPFTEDKVAVRQCFKSLKELRNDVQALQLPYAPCTELSMGMSNDYEIAIEEGATFLRIGSSLFE
ncbi:YggS family pyridoxal phosphate-dependent enzyme [Bacillus sp. DJP31]|uniref:YggS family pyridoxal phosphate-dependent enzyme n=1 Tax=Bacillus sp. DJP31 TaxID=3409789 RepID=UPI003BB6B8A2